MNYLAVLLIGMAMFLIGQTVQAFSISALIGFLSNRFKLRRRVREEAHWWGGSIVLSITLFFLLVSSLVQVGLWALVFVLIGQFEQYDQAFYHSAVNFATLGYGDIVMAEPWRLLGAMEAISGILMLGLSTATLSSVFLQLFKLRHR
ncbi:ion channel [Halomicronema sp. CCY15110]|uniref:ion channel n=1 Tax=Halomicronema sp. CCY15110 TaxID=2767773 RepID=UPI001951CF7E|nr:ion channel [Halomicronema sp. CCY15110]